jgi:hypothetical protein
MSSVLLSIYDVLVHVPVKQSSPCSVFWTEYEEFGFPLLWQYLLCGEVQYRTRVGHTDAINQPREIKNALWRTAI